MTEEEILLRLQERAPFNTQVEARSALHAVLAALRAGLQDEEALTLAEELGSSWAKPLLRGTYEGELTPEDFWSLTAFQEERRLAVATEHAQVVCSVLGELLSDSARKWLCAHLPQLASSFERSVPSEPPPALHPRRPPTDHTLAGGRPGSSRPLSDARPGSGQLSSDATPELDADLGGSLRRPTPT